MADSLAANTSDSSAPPALGKYAPFARLGHGGMADVFLAVARGPVGFNKLAVVKRLRNPEDSSRLEMFLDEARLSARLSHPNIVNTYEVGEAKGQYFIAMEYLEGQPLQALASNRTSSGKPLDETMATFIAMQALKGLHYAHELADYDGTPLQVVHRDVSPHNLFVTYRGEVKLLDFGIAKAALNSTHTETGVLKGKVRYMAPEQIGERSIDRRADVYALGIVLWEMLAGRALHKGDVTSMLTRITTEDAPLIRTIRPEVSPELEAVIARALQRDRDLRYATADNMRADLEHLLRGKQDGTEAALARLLDEAFAETRDAVRARIKTFLAEINSSTTSAPNLLQAAEVLPALFGDSGVGGGSGGSNSGASGSGSGRTPSGGSAGSNNAFLAPPGVTPSSMPRAPSRNAWIWGGAAALALVAIGVFAFRARSTPDSSPTAASVPPLAPVPSTTPVHIESTPTGALVEWNGQPLARTPADVQLPAGAQTLAISSDGYEQESLTIDVKAQEPTARTVVLRPKTDGAPSASATATTPHGGIGGHWPQQQPQMRPQTPPPATGATSTATTPRPRIRVVGDGDNP
jgi:serine/threonine protein kinase